jgi:spermidine synthase
VLVLDGVIQLTERDEFAYQEMIVHVPIFAHPNPQSVLIVGAGDGGVLREIVKHKGIKKIVQCEIDQRVVEVSKKFFGTSMATAFNDPRVDLRFMDAAEYMKAHSNEFDVIIVDSSDPVGPAETLYTSEFYANMHRALRSHGIVCTQGECMWLHLDLIERVLKDAKALYSSVDYAYSCVPTYPCGQIGFIIASKGNASLRRAKRSIPADMVPKLRYYTEEIHKASFTLPKFAEDKLESVRQKSAPICTPLWHYGGASVLAIVGVAVGIAVSRYLQRK